MLEFHISYLMVADLSRYNRLKHIPYIFLSHWPRVCAGQTDTIQITKTVRQIHSQIHICPLDVLLPITADQSRRRDHASGQCVLICTAKQSLFACATAKFNLKQHNRGCFTLSFLLVIFVWCLSLLGLVAKIKYICLFMLFLTSDTSSSVNTPWECYCLHGQTFLCFFHMKLVCREMIL